MNTTACMHALIFLNLKSNIAPIRYTHYYSQDNNGTIENEELRGFLKDLLELVKKVCYFSILYNIIVCTYRL